jgi:hypothetical protein
MRIFFTTSSSISTRLILARPIASRPIATAPRARVPIAIAPSAKAPIACAPTAKARIPTGLRSLAILSILSAVIESRLPVSERGATFFAAVVSYRSR